MNPDPSPHNPALPVYGEEADACYSVEVIAELAGTEVQTVLHYQEIGLISPVPRDAAERALFDAESLRRLRRIEHLRSTCGVNDTGLKLILDLLHEVECLREERRQSLR
ncbi:MAG: MerR family transcriptional regulator [Verrucomicrobia bacterium]|nr:MAG: MerR family transcriptional regulator [Verrucomicrobiota bacterium]